MTGAMAFEYRKNGTAQKKESPGPVTVGSKRMNRDTPVSEKSVGGVGGGIGFSHDLSKIPLQASHGDRHQAGQCSFSPARCPFGGACHACPAQVQTKLRIDEPGDKYEQEADRIADRVMRMPEPRMQWKKACPSCEEGEEPPQIQRKSINGATMEDSEKDRMGGPETAETSTDEELAAIQAKRANAQPRKNAAAPLPNSGSRQLTRPVQRKMENRFGQDFSSVRLHSGGGVDRFLSGHNAYAATHESNIYHRSSIDLNANQWLLSHELAHVIQQSGHLNAIGDERHLEHEADRAADAVMSDSPASIRRGFKPNGPTKTQFYSARICGRASTQFPDFPSTYINAISVDLTSPDHPVTVTWTGPNASRGDTGPFRSSPGAGKCNMDCNDETTSRTNDTMCTPKGNSTVDGYACALTSDSRATNATFFNRGRGIAFHYYPSVPTYPASHGCVRLESLQAARLIYDNSRSGETSVSVTGTWVRGKRRGRPVCY